MFYMIARQNSITSKKITISSPKTNALITVGKIIYNQLLKEGDTEN